MTIIFFFKISKIWCRFENWNKNWENVFRLSDACIWIGSCNFSQYWIGYMPSKGCLLTHWVPMARILFNIARICNSQLKCNYLKNEKLFLNFLFHFWNLHQILDILKKKMILIANVFPKLQTVKKFVTQLCKKGIFGILLESRHVKVPRILAKSPWECFYHVFSSIWRKLILKISLLGLDET